MNSTSLKEGGTRPAGRHAQKKRNQAIDKPVGCTDHIGEGNTRFCVDYRKLNAVRAFSSKKYLSMGREGSDIISIDDIREISGDVSNNPGVFEMHNAQIVGVLQLDSYKSCLRCKARVEPLTPPLGRCSNTECSMMQRLTVCMEHVVAKIMVLSGSKFMTLHAFGKIVNEIAGVTDK